MVDVKDSRWVVRTVDWMVAQKDKQWVALLDFEKVAWWVDKMVDLLAAQMVRNLGGL